MRKVKTFFNDFSQSLLPQPRYYQKIRKAKFSFSLKYFATLIFILNLVFFCLFFVTGLRQPSEFSLKDVASALKTYPPDLTIDLKNGNLSTNYNRPYFFWAQEGDRKLLLAVISQNSTPAEIQKFETPIMLTDRYLVFRSGAFPYPNLNLTVNKDSINHLLAGLTRIAPFLIILFSLFFLVIGPLFTIAGNFIYLVIVSLFCYFVFWLWSKKHSYRKTLQLSLHAVTLPFVTKYLLLGFGYNLDQAWPVFTLLTVVFILSALYETYMDK